MSIRDDMRQRSRKVWNGAKYAGIGFEFGLSIAICTYIGFKIDAYFNIEPFGVCCGVILGFSVGLRGLMRIVKQEQARFEQLQSTSSSSQPQANSTPQSTGITDYPLDSQPSKDTPKENH